MKILVLCGDYWHPPQIAREGLSALSGTEFSSDWLEDAENWSPETMMQYPVGVLTESDNISAGDQAGWMTPGHNQKVWLRASCQALLRNCLH